MFLYISNNVDRHHGIVALTRPVPRNMMYVIIVTTVRHGVGSRDAPQLRTDSCDITFICKHQLRTVYQSPLVFERALCMHFFPPPWLVYGT